MAESKMYQELRVVMVGKTGVGKSSLGNSLLQKKCFKARLSAKSVTEACEVAYRKLEIGRNLMIIDTPGLFDTGKPNEESMKEITKCIGLASPGPHIFIFVLNVTRFTPEELKTIEHLKETFGDAVIDYIILVFTGKDQLENDDDDSSDHENIRKYVENSPQCLRDFATGQCKGRFTAICNKPNHPDQLKDVQNIINLIINTTRTNHEKFYTMRMFEAAEAVIQAELKHRSSQGNPASREDIREEVASGKGIIWKRLLEIIQYIIATTVKEAGRVITTVIVEQFTNVL